jgi:hypothetical protein
MIAKSHIFSELKGSVGGITYFNTRYAAIVGRARVKPVDPQTCILENARRIFNNSVIAWKYLTDLQRDAWTLYAKDTPWKNGLGDTVYLTGQAMYIAQSSAYVAAKGNSARAACATAPCVPGLFPTPIVDVLCCTNPTIGCKVEITNMHLEANCDAIVRISPPQSLSTNYYNGPYVHDMEVLLTGISAGAADEAEWCPLCEAKYFFQVRAFDAVTNNNMSTLTHCEGVACTDPV